MSHVPRKRFGQHFLADRHYVERIVSAIDPKPADTVVEIGPGLGALTGPLLARLERLHVVEIDRDLAARLRETYPSDRVAVHVADALEFDFALLPEGLRVVGNLPYNISTPLLFRLVAYADRIRDLTFMLQKEVVDRMVAAPATPEYGRLSVMLQYRFAMARLFDVPPGAFRPPPKVDSAVVRMAPRPADELAARDPARLAALVTAAFGQRRKTLRNALAGLLGPDEFRDAGIDPGARGETLPVEAFVRLANIAYAPGAARG
ncbi:MAG: 16S rRNA (adenine(1518)-N(6)/adenine(1519)-N(6))-dimethyltransferase RsmA [Burkholderiales bacterium]|nr:16S rRNA (adenine(1518)-N(6)/adenine(1519)-N(6))-dimethyltransferase RsmA [Burkholderiales bacterium]